MSDGSIVEDSVVLSTSVQSLVIEIRCNNVAVLIDFKSNTRVVMI